VPARQYVHTPVGHHICSIHVAIATSDQAWVCCLYQSWMGPKSCASWCGSSSPPAGAERKRWTWRLGTHAAYCTVLCFRCVLCSPVDWVLHSMTALPVINQGLSHVCMHDLPSDHAPRRSSPKPSLLTPSCSISSSLCGMVPLPCCAVLPVFAVGDERTGE